MKNLFHVPYKTCENTESELMLVRLLQSVACGPLCCRRIVTEGVTVSVFALSYSIQSSSFVLFGFLFCFVVSHFLLSSAIILSDHLQS